MPRARCRVIQPSCMLGEFASESRIWGDKSEYCSFIVVIWVPLYFKGTQITIIMLVTSLFPPYSFLKVTSAPSGACSVCQLLNTKNSYYVNSFNPYRTYGEDGREVRISPGPCVLRSPTDADADGPKREFAHSHSSSRKLVLRSGWHIDEAITNLDKRTGHFHKTLSKGVQSVECRGFEISHLICDFPVRSQNTLHSVDFHFYRTRYRLAVFRD
jgi:hypothetical protein